MHTHTKALAVGRIPQLYNLQVEEIEFVAADGVTHFAVFSKNLATVYYLHMVLTPYHSDLLLATFPLNF